jgi:ketosteroid isomerase-like protein
MSDRARNIVEGLAAAWSSGDVEKILSFFTDDGVFEDVCNGVVFHGQEELKANFNDVLAAVPDLRLKIETLVATGNQLGCEWVETGMRNGRRFSLRGASIAELEGNKVRRESMYSHFDGATWLNP